MTLVARPAPAATPQPRPHRAPKVGGHAAHPVLNDLALDLDGQADSGRGGGDVSQAGIAGQEGGDDGRGGRRPHRRRPRWRRLREGEREGREG